MAAFFKTIGKLIFLALGLFIAVFAYFLVTSKPDPDYGKKLATKITSSCRAEYPYDDNLAMDCAIRLMGKALADGEHRKLERAARNAGVK